MRRALAPLLLVLAFAAGRAALAQPTITVLSGTYGGNVGAARGNVTPHLAAACNGKTSCAYAVLAGYIGDPVPYKAKDYRAEWTCTGDPTVRVATAPAEAGLGSVVTLSCSVPTPVPATPTTVPVPTVPGLGPRGYLIHYICSPACSTLDLQLTVGQRANGTVTVSVSPLP